jgi:hypothetical protein
MRLPLKLHPDYVCPAVRSLEAEALRPQPKMLSLRFGLAGDLGDLLLPEPAAPARTDELWRHTCFEAFVGAEGSEAYYEFNLSPSTEWAAYGFSGYRAGMYALSEVGDPRIALQTGPNRLELTAELDLSALPDLPPDAPWRLGLTAVIEQARGGVSYWALAHASGKADFHHPDCIASRVLAPERP